MVSPRQAIRILEQARDTLMARLIEEIVAEEEAILDDAEGNLFAGVIERIHDQIANRLSNVNAMLAQLSAASEMASPEVATADAGPVSESMLAAAATRLPPPDQVEPAITLSPQPTNGEHASAESVLFASGTDATSTGYFERFAREIEAGRIEAAAALLAPLFRLSLDATLPLAKRFWQRHTESGDAIAKAGQLRRELALGEVNGPLWLLWECFGLQGPQAVQLLQTLRANLHRW